MTAHDVSDLNHDGLQSDNLCAVIDRAYRGIASIQKFLSDTRSWFFLHGLTGSGGEFSQL